MSTTESSPFQLTTRTDYGDIIDSEFLRLLFAERLMFIRGSGWISRHTLEHLPGEVLASVTYHAAAREESLVRLDGAVVHAILADHALGVRIAAADAAGAEAALERLRRALPEAHGEDQEVPVRFWWWDHGAQQMAQMIPGNAWTDVEVNYGSQSATPLQALMSWPDAPPPGGRLLLWHGAPGTGKTTAIRTLAWEWRSWSEFQFITDPELFLSNPSYLLQAISRARRSTGGPANRWKVLVLEDAGEYLAPDAKHQAGQALSRLLNVCDGVVGQATRSLILVTTNEPVHVLHPALSRPGRCLAQIEFGALADSEIERWCRRCGVDAPRATRATLAELYAHAEGRATRGRRPEFGFAAVA